MAEKNEAEYLDEVFEALEAPERRETLQYLEENSVSTGSELIEYLETQIGEIEELNVQLRHSHLPKLKNAGWIDYDERPASMNDYDIIWDVGEEDAKDSLIMGYLDRIKGEKDVEELNQTFKVLKNPVRRKTLYWLREKQNNSDLSHIVAHLAVDDTINSSESGDQQPSKEEFRAIRGNMVNSHLPTLENLDIIEYDPNSQKISLTDTYADPDNQLMQFIEEIYDEE